MPKIPSGGGPTLINPNVAETPTGSGRNPVRAAKARMGQTIEKGAAQIAQIVGTLVKDTDTNDKLLDFEGEVGVATLEIQADYKKRGASYSDYAETVKNKTEELALKYQGDDFDRKSKGWKNNKFLAASSFGKTHENNRTLGLIDTGIAKAVSNIRLSSSPSEQVNIYNRETTQIMKTSGIGITKESAQVKMRKLAKDSANGVMNTLFANKDYDVGLTTLAGADEAMNPMLKEGLSADSYRMWNKAFATAKRQDHTKFITEMNAELKKNDTDIYSGKAAYNSGTRDNANKYLDSVREKISRMPASVDRDNLAINVTNDSMALEATTSMKTEDPARWIGIVEAVKFVGPYEKQEEAREKLRTYAARNAKKALNAPLDYILEQDPSMQGEAAEMGAPLSSYPDGGADAIVARRAFNSKNVAAQIAMGIPEGRIQYASTEVMNGYAQSFTSAKTPGELKDTFDTIAGTFYHGDGSAYYSVMDTLRSKGALQGGLGIYPSVNSDTSRAILIDNYVNREKIENEALPAVEAAVKKAIKVSSAFADMDESFSNANQKALTPDMQEAIRLYALKKSNKKSSISQIKHYVDQGIKIYYDDNFDTVGNLNGNVDLLIPRDSKRNINNTSISKFMSVTNDNIEMLGPIPLKSDLRDADDFKKTIQNDSFWKQRNDNSGLQMFRTDRNNATIPVQYINNERHIQFPRRRMPEDLIVKYDDMPRWVGRIKGKNKDKQEKLLAEEAAREKDIGLDSKATSKNVIQGRLKNQTLEQDPNAPQRRF